MQISVLIFINCVSNLQQLQCYNLPFLLFSKHEYFTILEIDKKILLLLGQLDLDQILDLFCFSFLYACNVLDCKIQREIRLNPSFDITLDSLFFFYHDKISSSFDEFHGNITVSWKLPTVTYCRNERYYKVRNLTDQVDKKDEKFSKLINKHKIKKMKGTKELHLMIQTPLLFCLCPDSGFFEQPASKKTVMVQKKVAP